MSDTSGFHILLRFFRILVIRKRMILLVTMLPTIICFIVVLVVHNTYKSEALINPPSKGSSPFESALKGSMGGEGFLGSFLGGSETGLNDCMSILSSSRFGKLVINRFDLETVYKFKRPGKTRKYFFADVLKEYYRHVGMDITGEDAIKIFVEDKSAERAEQMVSYMIHALDSLYTDIQKTAFRERLEYIDRRLALAENEMKTKEDSLVAFQNRHNLIIPDAQVRIILENATQTEVQVENLKEDLMLEAALRGTTGARYRDLLVKKNLLQRTLQRQLRNPSDSNSLILPARTLPALATEYFRLERDYNIKLGAYKYLVQQAEVLKLEVNKNVQVISIIDPPWTNDKKVGPKRRILIETVFILSFIFAALVAVLQAAWNNEGNSASRQLFSEIKKNIFKG